MLYEQQHRWTTGAIVTAPGATAALVTLAAIAGFGYRCYGFMVTMEEAVANTFEIMDGAVVAYLINVPAEFTYRIHQSDHPIITGTNGNLMSIRIRNAGAAGADYQAALLWS